MIKVKIDERMFTKAKRKASNLGILNQSITKGKGNVAGLLGEEMVLSYFPESESKNTFNFDVILNGYKIDVKTKRTSVIPEPHFECSISDYNTKQECDIYLFTRILVKNDSFPCGWLLGYIYKDIFYKLATFHKKGDLDPENNFTFKADCYNIPISLLNPIESLMRPANYYKPLKSVNLRELFHV